MDELVSSQFNLINNIDTAESKKVDFQLYYYIHQPVWFDISFTVIIVEKGMVVQCFYKNPIIDELEILEICKEFITVLKKRLLIPPMLR